MEQRRKNAAIGLVLIAILCFWLFINPQIKLLQMGYQAYRESATDVFLDYGKALETFQTKLDMLLSGDIKKPDETYYIEGNIAYYFSRANYKAARLTNRLEFDNYVYIYTNVNDVLKEILTDVAISDSEQKYLKKEFSTYTVNFLLKPKNY